MSRRRAKNGAAGSGRLIATLLGCVTLAAPELASAVPLADLLEQLRAEHIEVLYSTALVTPQMQAPAHAGGAGLIDQVRDALADHGLELRSIDAGQFIVVKSDGASSTDVKRTPAVAPTVVQAVSVYASRYATSNASVTPSNLLSTVQIAQVPGTKEDALRAAHAVPGLATNISARPYIRGSFADDILVEFDGVPLDDPFHFKNFQNLISAFDPAAVERIEIYSGGFPVRYGTRSGGVIDVEPRSLASGYEHSVGASLLAYDASTVGHREDPSIDWLATARHSVQDLMLRPPNEVQGAPRFADSLGRIRWRASERSSWTLGWLLLNDSISLEDQSEDASVAARYRDEYAWLALDSSLSDSFHWRTLLSGSHSNRFRTGHLEEAGLVTGQLKELRETARADFRSSWTFEPNSGWLWTSTIEVSRSSADLNYARSDQFAADIAGALDRSRNNDLITSAAPRVMTYGVSSAIRRSWDAFQAEVGARLDGQHFIRFGYRQQASPRLNARYDFSSRWRTFGSWGRFTQAQRADEWRLEDRQSTPDPSALATHTVLGLAFDDGRALRMTLEAYRKRWSEVRPYYDNLYNGLSLLPDLEPDRVRIAPRSSEASGVELSVHRIFGSNLEGWASYAYSRVVDDISGSDDDVRRGWDQPQALNLGAAWISGRWKTSSLLGWHRGWPRTPLELEAGSNLMYVGTRNSARWSNYFALDLASEWTRELPLGNFSVWLDLTNAADRDNACCEHLERNRAGALEDEQDHFLPRVLNLGFTWRFRRAP